jgi:thiamine-phosphate pyrophosphorylase
MGDPELLSQLLQVPAYHHKTDACPGLLLITDHTRFNGEGFFGCVEAALRGGVDAVMAREKQMDSARLLSFCSRLRGLTRRYGARLIVHTQADVALAVGADGIHVASADIGELPAMRRWLGNARMSLSASCHDAAQLRSAADAGADFAVLSPVFPTASHPGMPSLGVQGFCKLASAAPLPVVALGGITTSNRDQLPDFPVAVIGALLAADEPQRAAESLCRTASFA